jgi:membrane protein
MALHPPLMWTIFVRSLRAWYDDNVPRLGASVAYYTLFAVGPVLLIVIGVAGVAFGAESVRSQVVLQLQGLVGEQGAQAIEALLRAAAPRESGIVATAVGLVTLVLAATGAFLELQAAFDTIWRVKPAPSGNIRAFLMTRLRSFGLVVTIGFLLLVSLAVSAALAALQGWLDQLTPGLGYMWSVVNLVVSFAIISALFASLFRFLPDVELQWRDVIAGAIMTAVLFTIGKQLIGWYLGQSATTSAYGAAGSVIVLLLWVYYSAQIVLVGAEFTRLYAEHRGTPQTSPFATHVPGAHTAAAQHP